jgi:hypothetical protein
MPTIDVAPSVRRPEPFFILGAPRSGTSLLGRMLDSHAAIAVPDETKIFETFVPMLPLYGDLREPRRLQRLVRDILAWRWVQRLPDLPDAQTVLARVTQPELGSVFAALLGAWAERRGKGRWGEKTPRHIYFWSAIEAAFPKAVIVHIVRDGRDVALSQINAPFGPKTMAAAAERWVDFIHHIRAVGERIGPGRYVEIRYEDLLLQPQATITQVLQHLGEPFDPATLQFHKNARPVGTDPINDLNIARPLQVANAGKWAAQAGRHEIRLFESIAGATLDACGYRRATHAAPITPAQRAYRRYVEHPPRKIVGMLRNTAGIAEGIQRESIRWRLRVDGLLGRLSGDGPDQSAARPRTRS